MTGKIDFEPKLSKYLQSRTRSGEFSGVVLIQSAQNVLYQRAFGFAVRSWRVRNRVNTAFRTASISKMLTAAAVLQLIEAGRLDFDAPAVEILGLRETTIAPGVTVRRLLTMTAGIADWFEESGDWLTAWEALKRNTPLYLLRSNRDYLPLFASQPPNFPPGARFQYSNSSYILLGLILEAVSGADYFEYVRRNILDRCGMERSGFFAIDDNVERVAEGYDIVEVDGRRVWKRSIYDVTPVGAADGGLVATAADLVRFIQALRADAAADPGAAGKLLSPAIARAMLTPQVRENDERVRGYDWMYGFGNHFLLNERDEIVRWGHTGEEGGVSCRLFYYPRLDLEVVILGNLSGCAGAVGWKVHEWIEEQPL